MTNRVGIQLIVTIDQDDIDDAHDLFIDRLVDRHVEEDLQLYVFAEQPLERALAAHRRGTAADVRESVAHG